MPGLPVSVVAAVMLVLGHVWRVGHQPQPTHWVSTPSIVDRHGYALEEHRVTTEDGYVLTLHRLPPRPLWRHREQQKLPFWKWRWLSWSDPEVPEEPEDNATYPAVMVQHGLMGSSIDWTLPGPRRGLPYILVDEGYDVWLGNMRGNYYSRNHTSLHPERDKQKFWNFSWHEMGMYDLPACFDKILAVTGQEQLFYVGYSQGTTAFFVMGSQRPEACAKVRAMLALAPVAFVRHVRSPLIRMAARFDGMLSTMLKQLGMHELMPRSESLDSVGAAICRSQADNKDVCSNLLFLMAGYKSNHINTTLLPLIMISTPAGASTKQLLHYGQGIKSGKFRQFDYGRRNCEIYGSTTPPEYDLSRVNVPVALFHSRNDWLAPAQDVQRLYERLPARIGMFSVEDPEFTHLDFMWAQNARELVYDRLLAIMKRYSPQPPHQAEQ